MLVIDQDAPTNESTCEDRLQFARDTIEDVADRANGKCTHDSECALVFIDTQCQGACQAPILRANVDAFERAQQAIDERACTGYVQDGCAYATPACLRVQAVCDGTCTARPANQAGY